ncbi:MAG: aprX 2, partial [Acidobacteria bacterium]|nr:aprX 2 [Acidobacteriota bacterium]
STFYHAKAADQHHCNPNLGTKAYLSLSGTSMAAPVVAGTVALMLQANPNLTPNLIKALLQYTAQQYPGYSALRQGAGFLNTLGAVRLAKFYNSPKAGDRMPVQKVWSRHIDWGSHQLSGFIKPTANAWANNIVWGSAKTLGMDGDNIVWGTAADGDNIVWGTAMDGDNIVWGTAMDGDNIVWGTDCGGADCDNVVWGTASDGDNIVWGTAADGDNVVWGTSTDANVVWATSADDDATWGSDAGEEGAVFSDEVIEPLPSLDLEFGDMLAVSPVGTLLSTIVPSIGGL